MPDTGQKADVGGENDPEAWRPKMVGMDSDGKIKPFDKIAYPEQNAIVTGPARQLFCPRCKAYLGTIAEAGESIIVGSVIITKRVLLVCGNCRHGVLFRPSKK